jgi:hypothetical protein
MKNDILIPDHELLAMACEFDMGPEPILMGKLDWWKRYPLDAMMHHVYVKNMKNPDPEESDRWAILKEGRGSCLSKEGEWVYQPSPSNREDDFYDLCRYSSAQEAIEYYRRWKAALEEWCRERLAEKAMEMLKNPELSLVFNYEDCPKELLKF